MKLYLAGPMTGLPDFNFPLFNEAAVELRDVGYWVVNPAENFGGDTARPWVEYLRADIAALLECEAVATLPGWRRSRGARLEARIARELGMVVRPVDEWLEAA